MISHYSSELHSKTHSFTELESLVDFHSIDLKIGKEIDGKAFLLALAAVETSSVPLQPANNVCRFEYSYSRNSIAFKRSELLRAGYSKWGDLCAMSYGPWQILHIVAAEMGYPGHPMDLWSGVVSLPYVVAKINNNYSKGADSAPKLAASWNAGLGALKNKDKWPDAYVKKVLGFYEKYKLDLMKV